MKTDAEQALAEAYAAAKAKLPGDRKVVALREAAFGRFDALGLPHRRVEEWKYTDLRALMRDAKPLAGAAGRRRQGARRRTPAQLIGDIDARRIVFVDGAFVPELSDLADLVAGPDHPLDGAGAGGGRSAGRGASRQGRAGRQRGRGRAQHRVDARRRASSTSPRARRVERPIHLVFAATGDEPASVFTRSLVVIEQGARVMLVESHEAGRPRLSGQHRARARGRRRRPCRSHQDHRRGRRRWSMSRR